MGILRKFSDAASTDTNRAILLRAQGQQPKERTVSKKRRKIAKTAIAAATRLPRGGSVN